MTRLKTRLDGVATIVEHITSGPMIQLADGSDEKYKIIDTQDPTEFGSIARRTLWP